MSSTSRNANTQRPLQDLPQSILQVTDPERGGDCLLKNSVSFFFTLLKKDESCAQGKACLSLLLLLTVKSLIYFSKFF